MPLRTRPTFRPAVLELESRAVPSAVPVSADPVPAGQTPMVVVRDADGVAVATIAAYEPGMTGGVRVAVADLTGDGVMDIVTAPGAGGGPRVRVFDGTTFAPVADYFAYDPAFRGGVSVAAGALGNGTVGVATGPGVGGAPHVRVFTPAGAVVTEFFAHDPADRGGATVVLAAGPDGSAVLTASGAGWTTAFDPRTGAAAGSANDQQRVGAGGVDKDQDGPRHYVDDDGYPDGDGPDVRGDPVDLDGDGIPDGFALDLDGDGEPDGIEMDLDGDGEPDLIDYDGDGVTDGIGIDTNGDGIPDGVGYDLNGDGITDGVGIDTDGDGEIDRVDLDGDGDGDGIGIDINGDGRPDGIGRDGDGDGQPDGIDVNGDGVPDGISVDQNGDGEPDAVGYDLDEDGDIDYFDDTIPISTTVGGGNATVYISGDAYAVEQFGDEIDLQFYRSGGDLTSPLTVTYEVNWGTNGASRSDFSNPDILVLAGQTKATVTFDADQTFTRLGYASTVFLGDMSNKWLLPVADADVGPETFVVSVINGPGYNAAPAAFEAVAGRPGLRAKGSIECDILDKWALFGQHNHDRVNHNPQVVDPLVVNPNDIAQAKYDDCFVLSVAAAMAHHQPAKLMAMFSVSGRFVSTTFTHWNYGGTVPQTQTITTRVSLGGDGIETGLFSPNGMTTSRDADANNHMEIWPSLLENAYSVFRRNNGWTPLTDPAFPVYAIEHLTGRRAHQVVLPTSSSGFSAFDAAMEAGRVAVGGTWIDSWWTGRGNIVLSNGVELLRGHAYSFIGWTDGTKTAYKMYNPYGGYVIIPKADLACAFAAVSYELQ